MVFGYFLLLKMVMDEVVGVFSMSAYNGYTASAGSAIARAVVVMWYLLFDCLLLRIEDVFMIVGCFEVFLYLFVVMVVEGVNILLSRFGFSLYEILCYRYGLGYKFYDLDDENGWEVKIDDVCRFWDENMVVIVVNNLSNFCGAVFSEGYL